MSRRFILLVAAFVIGVYVGTYYGLTAHNPGFRGVSE